MTDFSSIYRTYAADVFRFALFLSGNRGEAEDITSETFVRAWAGFGRIDASTVKGYLLAIARNLFLQSRRRSSRPVALDDNLRDGRPGPESVTEDRSRFRAVMARLQTLPEIDRAALLMSAWGGLRYAEIAATLGISLSAVKMKIHRSRLALSSLEDVR